MIILRYNSGPCQSLQSAGKCILWRPAAGSDSFSCLFTSKSHTAGGRGAEDKLEPDPRFVHVSKPDADRRGTEQPVGQVGSSWQLDHLGARLPGPTSFVPNMAVVMCKGPFHDSEDPALAGSVCYSMAVAQVPDCVPLLPFNTLREAFKNHTDNEYTAMWLDEISRRFPRLPRCVLPLLSTASHHHGYGKWGISLRGCRRICSRLPYLASPGCQ